jgi:hypothetical protein
VTGSSGTTALTADPPIIDSGELPTLFTATTLAITDVPISRLKGVYWRAAIGISQLCDYMTI